MSASPSASSTLSSSCTRDASPRAGAKSTRGGGNGVSDAYQEDFLSSPASGCEFIQVPQPHQPRFAYLHETQLFFFGVLRKVNRTHTKGKRVCFITDYTINLASPDTGKVSRCSKVEDVAELICHVRSRAIGIRMRVRPFAVEPSSYLQWNCFYEMPVDLLLYADSTEQLGDLLRVLRGVYLRCTAKEMPCRVLGPREEWEAILVLWPDGSRVKKRAMMYHRIPSATDAPAAPLTAASRGSERPLDIPRTRGRRSASAPGRVASTDALVASSPPPRPPPPRTSCSSSPRRMNGEERLAQEEALVTPPRLYHVAEPYQATVKRDSIVESYSATRRHRNPLAQQQQRAPTAEKRLPAGTVARSQPARSRASSAEDGRRHDEDDDDDEEVMADLYTPPTPPPQESIEQSIRKVKALEATVKAQQMRIHELRQSRYSKECELDDLKRHLSAVTVSYEGSQNSRDFSARRRQIQLPEATESATGRRGKGSNGKHDRLSAHRKKSNTHRKALPRELALMFDESSSSSHEAHLSSVKPIPSSGRREVAHASPSGDYDNQSTVRVAEQKLKAALHGHREFEETVWSYYNSLPAELQKKLKTFRGGPPCNDSRSRHEQPTPPHSMKRELTYLRELVRQSEGGRAQSPHVRTDASSIQAEESMSIVGDQIDAFAQELSRKQREINQLRRQLQETTDARP